MTRHEPPDPHARPLRCVVIAPVAVPYREPLFAALAARSELAIHVLYQADSLTGWDVGRDWYPAVHPYPSGVLAALQVPRAGRGPITVPGGLGRALSRHAPAVVVAFEFGPAALLARAWCRRHGAGLVHFSELGATAALEVPAAQRRLHSVLAARAAAAIGASTPAAERLVAIGVDARLTTMSLQSVDAEPIRAATAARPPALPGQPLRLLCVARLVPDKNHAALIDAAAAAGGVELDLVGDGPLRDALQAQAAQRGVLTRFHGALSPAQTSEIYARADALALVSHFEPFGVALREGVAAGLPLIASARAGATGDIALSGRNAIVVDPSDRAAITAAVAAVAAEPERRRAMAAASREIDLAWPLERSVEPFARAIGLAAEHAARVRRADRRADGRAGQRERPNSP